MSTFSYWAGLDTPGATPSDVQRFNDFYWSIHVPEVMSNNPGFLRCDRFELVQPDERGDLGPRWLARYRMSAAAAENYLEENSRPGYVMPYTPLPDLACDIVVRWRLLWQHLTSTGEPSYESSRLRLIGMDPWPQASQGQLDEFNDFYTDVHLAEALEVLGATQVSRYELVRDFRDEDGVCPRYAALYELDRPSFAPETWKLPLSAGPIAWEKRITRWRLEYARIEKPL